MKRFDILLTAILLGGLLLLSACGGEATESANNESESSGPERVASGDPEAGEDKFNEVCIACHGPGGVGIEGLGKPFTTSDFLLAQSDEELLAFIKKGRPVGDPTNTTGVDMPPKGGNPALTDEQIMDIIAYVRTLHD
ncbi:MAG: cytochrome c [Anaerolineales bacterium]|nr:cytochrome c [Anaerolineales bacterium]MCB0005405.1 cytochrome c [Anaerolineales bacterium]MCB0014167.1 cytochrome c [Anaerolineales bacterium]MCB8961763.1 cytochrome c [Ardenticatenales bacterium]